MKLTICPLIRWALLLAALGGGTPVRQAAAQAPPGSQAQQPPEDKAQQPQIAKPIEFSRTIAYSLATDGTPLVQVVLDGKVTATFDLDTGANYTLISESLAKRLGLPTTTRRVAGQTQRLATVPHLLIQTARAEDPRFRSFRCDDVPVAVMPDRYLNPPRTLFHMQQVDGCVGAGLFSNVALLWNFPQRWVRFLYSPGQEYTPERLAGVGMAGAVAAPIADQHDLLFRVPVRLTSGGKSVTEGLIVDTGAAQTVIPRRAAEQLGLEPLARGLALVGNIGTAAFDRSWLPDAAIGDARLSGLAVYYQQGEAIKLLTANLGMDALSRFYVLLDYPNRKMYLLPVTLPAAVGPAPSAVTPSPAIPVK